MTMPLREVDEADIEEFYEHQREPEACAMAQFPPRDRDRFLQRWWMSLEDDAVCKRTIVEGDRVAGYVASWNEGERRLVAYWLGKAFWGRGVATAALAEFLERDETTRPLHAFVATRNRASRRVLEKCGFSLASEAEEGPDGIEEILMKLAGA